MFGKPHGEQDGGRRIIIPIIESMRVSLLHIAMFVGYLRKNRTSPERQTVHASQPRVNYHSKRGFYEQHDPIVIDTRVDHVVDR